QALREGRDDPDLELDLRVVGSDLCRRPGADRGDARSAAPPFDSGGHSGGKLPAQGQAPRWYAEGAGRRAEHARTGMTRSLPRWVQDPPARRSARLVVVAAQRAGPPVHYLDKLHRPSLKARGWINFQSATPNKLGQN